MTPTQRLSLLAGLCCPMLMGIAAAQAGQDDPAQQSPVVSQIDAPPSSPGLERLEVGVAVDSDDGLIGSVYAGKNNLIPGVFTFASLRYARETQRGQIGLFKPDALGKNIHAGIDLNYHRDAYDDQGYSQTNLGIEPYLQFQSERWGTLTTGLGYRSVTLDGIAANAPKSFYKDQGTDEGIYAHVSYTLSDLIQTKRFNLSLGTDNYVYNLTSANRTLFQTEGWSHAKIDIVPDDLSLLNSVRVGYMRGLDGQAPRLADRYFIGGADLRGFQARHVGPYDGNYFLGGERYATASFDLAKKVGTLWGSPVSVSAFFDMGSLWMLDPQVDTPVNTRGIIRSSTGLAMTIAVAGLPVSLYVAKPLKKEPQDVAQNFGMSVSMRF